MMVREDFRVTRAGERIHRILALRLDSARVIGGSGEDLLDDRARDVGEPVFAAAVAVGRSGVVEAEPVADDRVGELGS
jgi:hypothetical protein